MDCIVSASELYQRVKEIMDDGMDCVSVSLIEPDDSLPGDDPLPSCVHLEACKKSSCYEWVIYDDVEALESLE